MNCDETFNAGICYVTDAYKRACRFNDELHEDLEKYRTENAKLRKLVTDMWFWSYCGYIDSESQEKQIAHIDSVIKRMRELGIEVA